MVAWSDKDPLDVRWAEPELGSAQVAGTVVNLWREEAEVAEVQQSADIWGMLRAPWNSRYFCCDPR